MTQKHHRVEKPGQKPNRLHEPPNWPSQRTRRAQACARVAMSWPAQRRIVTGLPGRIVASGCRVVAPQRRITDIVPLAPARYAARAVPCAPTRLAPRPCASCRACRGPPWPYREHSATRQRRVVGVCARRIGRIVVCLASHCPASSSLPVAIHCIVLQCNSSQTRLPQYNILYCNTVYSLPT